MTRSASGRHARFAWTLLLSSIHFGCNLTQPFVDSPDAGPPDLTWSKLSCEWISPANPVNASPNTPPMGISHMAVGSLQHIERTSGFRGFPTTFRYFEGEVWYAFAASLCNGVRSQSANFLLVNRFKPNQDGSATKNTPRCLVPNPAPLDAQMVAGPGRTILYRTFGHRAYLGSVEFAAADPAWRLYADLPGQSTMGASISEYALAFNASSNLAAAPSLYHLQISRFDRALKPLDEPMLLPGDDLRLAHLLGVQGRWWLAGMLDDHRSRVYEVGNDGSPCRVFSPAAIDLNTGTSISDTAPDGDGITYGMPVGRRLYLTHVQGDGTAFTRLLQDARFDTASPQAHLYFGGGRRFALFEDVDTVYAGRNRYLNHVLVAELDESLQIIDQVEVAKAKIPESYAAGLALTFDPDRNGLWAIISMDHQFAKGEDPYAADLYAVFVQLDAK